MWDRFLRWCYPNVANEVPRRGLRGDLDLRPFLLIGALILLFKVFS